jgi:hypothetical protein
MLFNSSASSLILCKIQPLPHRNTNSSGTSASNLLACCFADSAISFYLPGHFGQVTFYVLPVFYTFFAGRPVPLLSQLAFTACEVASFHPVKALILLFFLAAAALALPFGGAGHAAVKGAPFFVSVLADLTTAYRTKLLYHFSPPAIFGIFSSADPVRPFVEPIIKSRR